MTATANEHALKAHEVSKFCVSIPGPCVLRILESWVVCSTVMNLVPWYVSLTTAVGGPTPDPRPVSCDESLAMLAWHRFGRGKLGLQVDCTVCRHISPMKMKQHGGSLNHPKGNTGGWWKGRHNKHVTCRPLRPNASLHPRIPSTVSYNKIAPHDITKKCQSSLTQ